MEIQQLFKIILTMSLFYSFIITGYVHYILPDDAIVYVSDFTSLSNKVEMQGTSDIVKGSLERQTKANIVEIGALVFFTGNILIDLLLNLVFAIPEMLGLLVSVFTHLFNVSAVLVALVETFAGVLFTVMYFIGLIQLVTGIRSGRVI